ncbi:CRIB domain-containing protein RIC6 [Sesamum indicum]|uniref:CRIB domain-containing protein RIC6 n=1 Tax=Sesamum indicum TaxID=4182 RepID=A0A6I9TPL1_SESIN|nr:CRIB domain-containing protein RIC6 [Sesamum indicum]
MSTKMKGLLKGLRYISQIFDEEKEQDMQIGLPTDVKHVAHIGWDGPKVDSPSWMKEFKSSNGGFQSAPLAPPIESRQDDSEIQWVSEDSKRGQKPTNSAPGKDHPELPKTSRRNHSSNDQNNSNHDSSPKKKDSSSKSRPRRSKEQLSSSEGGSKAAGQQQEAGSASPGPNLPDAPKKTRRKKSKESINKEHGSTRIRSKANTSSSKGTHKSDPTTGSESDSVSQASSSHLSSAIDDEESESIRGNSKE